MDIPGATFWWVAAGVAVAAELATGTFHLLMFGLGLAAAAVAAHLGLSGSAQLAIAALVGGGATLGCHWLRARAPSEGPVPENRNVNLDVGETVQVHAWALDRTTRVHHRGAAWTAKLAAESPARSGEHVVSAVEGNWLVLKPVSRRPLP